MTFHLFLLCVTLLVHGATHVSSDHDEKVLKVSGTERSYQLGERVLVECLNRTSDTGEHVSLFTTRTCQEKRPA